jgi:1,4-alpha-glucan branching enzyme
MRNSHKWKESIYEKMLFNPGNANPEPQVPLRRITFYYAAPRAKLVGIAGDFNQWQPLPLQRLDDGWWFVQTHLRYGLHYYRFMVDNQPVLDPHAPGVVRDERNLPVSVIDVA